MDKYAEIAELLWHLVSGRCEPTGDTQPDVDEKRASDGQTSQEVVQCIPNQDEICQRLPTITLRAMAMVPVKSLFEKKEYCETHRNRDTNFQTRSTGIERRRNHVKKCTANQ